MDRLRISASGHWRRDDLGLLCRYIVPQRERGYLLEPLVVVAPQKVLAEQETEAIARAAEAMAAQMYAEHLAADTRRPTSGPWCRS